MSTGVIDLRPKFCKQGNELDSDNALGLHISMGQLQDVKRRLDDCITEEIVRYPHLAYLLKPTAQRIADDLSIDISYYKLRIADLGHFPENGTAAVYSTPSQGFRGRKGYWLYTLHIESWQRLTAMMECDTESDEDSTFSGSENSNSGSSSGSSSDDSEEDERWPEATTLTDRPKKVRIMDMNGTPLDDEDEEETVRSLVDMKKIMALLEKRAFIEAHHPPSDEVVLARSNVQVNNAYYRASRLAKIVYMWVPEKLILPAASS